MNNFYNSNNNSSNNNYTMFVITKDSNNKPYNKSNVSKIIIIKSHWLRSEDAF